MIRPAASFALIPVIMLAVGCAYQPAQSTQQASRAQATPAERVLRVEGNSIILGQAAAQPLSAASLIDRVGALLSAGDYAAAHDLLTRFPNLAREALLDSDLVRHRSALALAVWLDQQAAPARGGWGRLVDDRGQHPERYTRYDRQRRSVWAAFRKGEFASTTRIDLQAPKDSPTPWPAIDAAVLRATALLAGGKPGDAAPLFEDAAERASAWDPDFADRQWLFAALSHRMAGRPIQAQQIEQRVTSLDPARLAQVQDPMILRLALKTAGKNAAMTRAGGFSERAVYARLGQVELQRGAPQAALLSFRTAESQPGLSPRTPQLRLKQAEALLALRQEQPAIVMLAGLANGETRPEALAMLGRVHLQRNQIETGMAMLREAVRLTTAESHPQIHANAGLTLLSAGQREPGMRLLHDSRTAYQRRGDHSAVRQSLVNELRYAEAAGDAELVQSVRGQLTALRFER
ncbi:MAG: hypothetical protein AAF750_09645 [Planctomycetota bacterium]